MAEPVRVLQVIKGLGPGGAERLLVSMAEVADRDEVAYEVAYLLPHKRALVEDLGELGVPTHLLAGSAGFADPRWPWRLRRLAHGFDVVHVHSPAVAAIARPALASGRTRPVLVSTEHNVWASHGAPTRVANALTSGLDDQRWAVSREVADSADSGRGGGAEVLVHGAPVAALAARAATEREPARAREGWAPDDVVVVIVANLRAQKDYPTLFAAAELAIARDPHLRFVSIGQGPLEDELRTDLAARDLGDRFVMLGYHPDPPAVVAGADVFTLSSIHEGLPISLVEAMAMGVPPVATDVGGVAEVISDGRNGVVVPPRRPDLLADAYVELAARPDHRRALGEAAARGALDFDIARTARIVEARYRDLVHQRRR